VLDTLFDALGLPALPARVVEVGCGTGTLSIWLASRVGADGAVESFDVDPRAVERAISEARAAGSTNIRFAVGDVNDLPVPPCSVDVVVCRQLLCVLKDPARAVRNMANVLRPGGELVAIEPATAQSVLDPGDARFSRLSERLLHAFQVGWQRQHADPKVGLRAPQLFLDAGLEHVRADAIAQLHLLCDARRPVRDVLDQLETEAAHLPLPAREMLRRGGFSLRNQHAIQSTAAARLEEVGEELSRIAHSGYTRLMATQIVIVGRKS